MDAAGLWSATRNAIEREIIDSLPGADATLEEIIRFARTADPTARFHERWGGEYADKARSLWNRCVQSFAAGEEPPGDRDELLLCLAYDVSLGPYLGVPEVHKLAFLRWLLNGIRRSVQPS